MTKNYMKGIVIITLSALFVAIMHLDINAQKVNGQNEYYGETASEKLPGTKYILDGLTSPYPVYVKFKEEDAVPFDSFFSWLSENLNLGTEVNFNLLEQFADDLGFVHYRYVQYVEGLPVNFAIYHIQVLNGKVVSFNGEIYKIPNQSASPAISEERALNSALEYIGAENYMWDNPYWENEIKQKENNPEATYYPTGILCWDRPLNANTKNSNFTLAYRFDIWAEGGLGSQRVTVDANTGEILNGIPLESNCSPASVNTIFNGTQSISTDNYSGSTYRLRDDCQSAEIWIRDWNSSTTTANPVEIENTTNTWTTMNERFGGTVLWQVKQSYQYFLDAHSRSSYDDNDGDVTGYINAIFSCTPPPTPCYTANNASMSFTGGTLKVGLSSAGTLANSYATVDIIAHEYTHAVTGSTSALVYANESGALNESFSDIFGEAVERYVTGSNDWLVGDERTNGAIRSLSNPNDGNDPDTYMGINWFTGSGDNGGVHTNSGVQNFWFYLLATGGTGTNDNGDSYDVTGLGFDIARYIAYRNNTVKLTTNSNYAAARAGAIEAAEDLSSACSGYVIEVKNAWYAVGVGNPGMPSFSAIYFEPDVCTGEAFSIDLQSKRNFNLVTPTYNWTANYNGLTGGAGAGSGLTIDETLVNNTTDPIYAIYTVTPSYDGCTGSSFDIDIKINPRPSGMNSSTNVLCSGDEFTIDLQSNITNGVPADFSWTANYNGLTGGSGAGSGDYINESLENNTGAIASAVYTVTPESEFGACENTAFMVTVTVPPVLSIDAGPNQTVYYGYPPAECATLSWSDAMGGTPPYTYMWSTGENSQEIEVCPGNTTTMYYVTITDDNNCTATDSVLVCVIDVRCGKKLDKVELCHIPNGASIGNSDVQKTVCVAIPAVEKHLSSGDVLGACGIDHSCPPAKTSAIAGNTTDASGDLTVYPNPTMGLVNIILPDSKPASLIIYDMQGVEVLKTDLTGVNESYLADLSSYGDGIFFISVATDGKTYTEKVILKK